MNKTPAKSDKQAKAARLQAALRDNLRRRKQADQAVASPPPEPTDERS